MDGWRPAVGVAVGALLLVGCTSGSGSEAEAEGEPKEGAGTRSSPSPGSSASAAADEPYTLAESQAPKTRGEAVAFVRGIDVRPDYFGTGYRKRNPFESDPAQWAVLGEDCLWRREALPETALASLTRAFEMPEQGGKEAVYVSLTVTVHDSVAVARRDMAGALETALRCPEQRLNATDVVQGLYSRVDASTDLRNAVTEDDLVESGEWVVDGENKAHPFDWYKFRLGSVTVAATARHGAGRSKEEDAAISSDLAKGVGFVAAEIDRWGKAGGESAEGDSGGADGATDEPVETKGAEQ